MNINNFPSRVPPHYWGYLALSLWGLVSLLTLRHDPYNLDESAARDLLLIWSVVDQIANAVVTFGIPDLRILPFAPIGFLWTGSVFAAKVFTILLSVGAAWSLFLWESRRISTEAALLATGLLILSPLILTQIDSLSPGVYLLLAFALGEVLDNTYRASPKPFGGNYFAQLFLCAFSVSLHPAGLAYPLVLLWEWHKNPLTDKQKKYFFAGILFVTLFTLAIRMGWNDTAWLQNPIDSLAAIALGISTGSEMNAARWVAGGIAAAILIAVITRQFHELWRDTTGRILLLGLMLGAPTFDTTWATIALAIILYFGTPLLLQAQQLSRDSFAGQRGIALLAIFLLCTLFLHTDKTRYELQKNGQLSGEDQLIQAVADKVEETRKAREQDGRELAAPLRIASQWPSRTMVACKCDTLPLPPATKDSQTQLATMRGISYLLLDPRHPDNMLLSRNLAMLGNVVETVALQREGVLLHIKENPPSP